MAGVGKTALASFLKTNMQYKLKLEVLSVIELIGRYSSDSEGILQGMV